MTQGSFRTGKSVEVRLVKPKAGEMMVLDIKSEIANRSG